MAEIVAYKAVWTVQQEVYQDSLSVSAYYDPVEVGETVSLQSTVAGFGDYDIAYQWQRSTDGTTWTDIADATDEVYGFALAASDVGAFFRVLATASQGGQTVSTIASDAVEMQAMEGGE
jgi:hypothetical protein